MTHSLFNQYPFTFAKNRNDVNPTHLLELSSLNLTDFLVFGGFAFLSRPKTIKCVSVIIFFLNNLLTP